MQSYLSKRNPREELDCYEIADRILNHSVLYVTNRAYRIIEIEFYLYDNNHPDPYTHKNPIQKT